jgi:hypothetical protein
MSADCRDITLIGGLLHGSVLPHTFPRPAVGASICIRLDAGKAGALVSFYLRVASNVAVYDGDHS